jgi:hypothetical protein
MDNFDLEIKNHINLFEIEMRDRMKFGKISYQLSDEITDLLENEAASLDELDNVLYHEIHYK